MCGLGNEKRRDYVATIKDVLFKWSGLCVTSVFMFLRTCNKKLFVDHVKGHDGSFFIQMDL